MKPDAKARAFAKRNGYKVRLIPHSQKHPNGYVRINTPDGRELKATGWMDAHKVMYFDHITRRR
jgi:intein/homing endonuclease